MYQNVKRMCRAIVFAHEAHSFVAFSLPAPSSFLKLPYIIGLYDDETKKQYKQYVLLTETMKTGNE